MPPLTLESALITAVGVLSGVVVMLWRENLKKENEIKALIREMFTHAAKLGERLGNARPPRRSQDEPLTPAPPFDPLAR